MSGDELRKRGFRAAAGDRSGQDNPSDDAYEDRDGYPGSPSATQLAAKR
jgi:hypothetical protein